MAERGGTQGAAAAGTAGLEKKDISRAVNGATGWGSTARQRSPGKGVEDPWAGTAGCRRPGVRGPGTAVSTVGMARLPSHSHPYLASM